MYVMCVCGTVVRLHSQSQIRSHTYAISTPPTQGELWKRVNTEECYWTIGNVSHNRMRTHDLFAHTLMHFFVMLAHTRGCAQWQGP